MAEQSTTEHLLVAIKTEEEGRAFYVQAAAKASHPLARDTFAALAADEEHHLRYLKDVYARIHHIGAEDQVWEQPVIAEAEVEKQDLPRRIKTIFSKALKRADTQVKPDTQVLEIYAMATNFERAGIEFYGELAEEENDPRAKQFYAALQEMEQHHLTLLENSLQLLENPAQWFSQQERWMIEG